MTKYGVFIISFFIIQASHGQTNNKLEAVYWNRTLGNNYLNFIEQIDSAMFYYELYVDDTLYSNAKDKLSYADCCLRKGNKQLFFKYIKKSILDGATPELIDNWMIRNKKYQGRIRDSVATIYVPLRRQYWGMIDTTAYNEIDRILKFDKYVRLYVPQDDEERNAWWQMLKITDSVNYIKVRQLIEKRGYPGYHVIGFQSENLIPILMHITDESEERWKYVFDLLKIEVLKGNITPQAVGMIADRHYKHSDPSKYYYGVLPGEFPLFDCKNVDAERAKIGLSPLRKEYILFHRPIPECYGK